MIDIRHRLLSTGLLLVSILTLSGCATDMPRLFSFLRQPEEQAAAKPAPPGSKTAERIQPPSVPDRITPAPPPTDLWERLRHGFRLSDVQHPRVTLELKWLRDHPSYLEHTARRAEPYLFFITAELERRGLPHELALIPAIESGYQPGARSPYGAAGLWQFMPTTGLAHGLRQSWWYEGRCDVQASTRAALDYLQDLAAQFDGEWTLALAAYNAGPGTLRRAIRRNREQGLPTDYWSLELPRETLQYVPRLLALAQMVTQPAANGVTLAPIHNRPHFAAVELPGQIDLDLAADMAGVSRERLAQLNPGFLRWATDPAGPHRLLLPASRVGTFRHRLAELDPDRRVTWHRYRIRQGDNLGAIARRHGVSVTLLQKVNRLRGNRIRAGRDLLIPKTDGGAALLAQAGPAAVPVNRGTYLVQPGDTLWAIARRHDLNHRKLAAWNGLSVNTTLRPGQTLRLTPGGTRDPKRSFSYRVRKGDSLYLIAQRFQVSVKDLRRWNTLSDRYLRPGQELTLQVGDGPSAL